jgi:hypothetical protein
MDREDNGQNLEKLAQSIDELARRLEALEREDRESRKVVGNGASARRLETPQQRPQATQVNEMAVASPKTVRGLLLGPRDEQAYSRPLVGVLPSYMVGWLLTCAIAAYGPYVALISAEGEDLRWLGLGVIASLFFGVYAGIRDGSKFALARFQFVGLITAIGTAVVIFLTSLWFVSYFWRPPPAGGALRWIVEDVLFPTGAVFVSTWLLFVSGVLLGTALQIWANEKVRVGREGSIQGSGEAGSASTSGVRTQVWLGFAGTVLAALISLIGTLIAS